MTDGCVPVKHVSSFVEPFVASGAASVMHDPLRVIMAHTGHARLYDYSALMVVLC